MNLLDINKDMQAKKPRTVSKKMKWTPAEDEILIARVKKFGTGNWSLIAQELSGRTGKQCRERWTNQLNPNLNRDNWTLSEDRILLQQQQICGNSWSKIAMFLPGRSSNSVKNRWSWLVRHRIMPNAVARPTPIVRQTKPEKPPVVEKPKEEITQQPPAQILPLDNQIYMNFAPTIPDTFDPLHLLIVGTSNDLIINDYNSIGMLSYEPLDTSVTLWDTL